MKSAIPKQFLPLAGSPVLFRTIRAFAAVPGMRVVLVLPEAQMSTWDELCHSESLGVDVEVAFGGKTRHESVSNGLALWHGERLVGVHDGVRPLVTPDFIKSVYAEAFKSGMPSLSCPLSSLFGLLMRTVAAMRWTGLL